MTFLEALYGSQYQEITANGKDGQKGRINGNMFLAVLSLLVLVDTVLVLKLLDTHLLAQSLEKIPVFRYMTGKTLGKVLGLVAFAISYFIIGQTVGSIQNYNRIIDSFMQLPEDTRKTANKKVLTVFFTVFAIFMIFIFL